MRLRGGLGEYRVWLALVLVAVVVAACTRSFDDCATAAECVGNTGVAMQSSADAGAAAIGGAGSGESEPTLLPACTFGEGVAIQRLLGLAVSKAGDGSSINAYSWDEATNSAVVRWTTQLAPIQWTPWQCFDLLPGVTRLTALNLANLQPEVYALSSTGVLFVRRDTTQGWTPWLPFGLPFRTSVISDVASVSGKLARVYVADSAERQVFVRRKVSPTAFADYGPWQPLEPNDPERLTALERRDHRQQVISVTRAGTVQTAVQAPSAERFDAWSSLAELDDEPLELDAVDTGTLVVYALDAEGTVRTLLADTPNATWVPLSQPESLGKIVGIAAWVEGDVPVLATVDAEGTADVRVGL